MLPVVKMIAAGPHALPRQKDWHVRIGRVHAEHFDRHGFAYASREMFDAFGPQYGSTWPTLHGSIGILWEEFESMSHITFPYLRSYRFETLKDLFMNMVGASFICLFINDIICKAVRM